MMTRNTATVTTKTMMKRASMATIVVAEEAEAAREAAAPPTDATVMEPATTVEPDTAVAQA
jgi:hypothetical protein